LLTPTPLEQERRASVPTDGLQLVKRRRFQTSKDFINEDWNDAYKAGVNIRAMADKVNAYKGDNVVPLHGAPQTGPQLLTRCAAEIEPEPIDWIWDGRIARGKLTVIGGDPEEGKSQLGVFISATISNGGTWPNNEGRAPRGSVIFLSAEDGAEDTLVPRLIAAGADRRKIHLIEAVRARTRRGGVRSICKPICCCSNRRSRRSVT
jgi:hypothetical protein